jgi:hypothetical protein
LQLGVVRPIYRRRYLFHYLQPTAELNLQCHLSLE